MKYLLCILVLLCAASVEAHGFGNQAFVFNRGGFRQPVVVNRFNGFNRQAVVVGNRPQVIIQRNGFFGGNLFGRQQVIFVH